ncbi:hypothetical protein FRB98_009526 [Tulasnella sp. 332]|nr:hypothetical protein FRB98_009526 [Tulasnella sp. 332]
MDGAEIDPAPIPSLSSGSVGSRFVSQNDIDAANATRDEQWKAAYARLTFSVTIVVLYTILRLIAMCTKDLDKNRLHDPKRMHTMTMKQEEWDEKMKLGNQFRGIDEEDSAFLAAVQDEKREQERQRKMVEAEELAAFKAGQVKRAAEEAAATIIQSSREAGPSSNAASTPKPTQPIAKKQGSGNIIKKDQKTLLKGVIKKKPTKGKDTGQWKGAVVAVEKPKENVLKQDVPKSASNPSLVKPTAQAIRAQGSLVDESKKRRASLVEGDGLGSDDDESGSEPETKKARTGAL